ncbi:hypothetical protein M409DRAFT_25540 [Zasmidium cellare ATCC 36951]|uniref:Uncharacterized protein n=1 Tax=Zasmidium cellare ATCC 36951 TaxID=1080233 RepID=A0A6A6CAI0_ZASCE|nr:uncharacterized protein M409DRAFT_25540 [Zasmidium cellare ATCC 36951]KAF2164197.1 hypothetical protein M409DRAFT_25540 [Zasmidium cellare ATCC 36951]
MSFDGVRLACHPAPRIATTAYTDNGLRYLHIHSCPKVSSTVAEERVARRIEQDRPMARPGIYILSSNLSVQQG